MDNDSKSLIIVSCFDCYIPIILYLVAVKVSFKRSTYSGTEKSKDRVIRKVQVGLVLSNPSSTDITIKVEDSGGTATGMYRQPLLHNLY